VEVLGACTSYEASDFDATCRFYEHVLGLERVVSWDRSDSQGAYFGASRTLVVEIVGAPRGTTHAHRSSHEDGLAVTLMVDDARKALAEIEERGGVADRALVVSDWGRHFGVRDPDGVRVWIMERLVE
jgi:predicted enzyme related to lactoylglutathione lyase